MSDGARDALLGYLYQFASVASISVGRLTDGDDFWAELVVRAKQGRLAHERLGQDATIVDELVPSAGTVAIQFKYSAGGTPVAVLDLVDIAEAFDRTKAEAAKHSEVIGRYILVTNRALDSAAQQLIADSQRERPPKALVLRTTRAGKAIATSTSRLKRHGGNPAIAAAVWHPVVKALEVRTGLPLEVGFERLRAFAQRHGVNDSECADGIKRLVGALVSDTALGRSVEVSTEWLKEHLCGDSRAACLEFGSREEPHIATLCRERLESRARDQHRVPRPRYLRRRRVEQQLREALNKYQVVFVHGDGGCGKSWAVLEYLHPQCESQLVWSAAAHDAGERAIVQAVNYLMAPGGRNGIAHDASLRALRARLARANPQRSDLLTIDLDGVDEARERQSDIRELIRICRAGGRRHESPAALILTCRESQPDQLKYEWCDTADADLIADVGFVTVGDFADDELVAAAALYDGAPEERIALALDPIAGNATLANRRVGDEPVAREMIDSLRHPLVWGAYASLDEDEREGVLAGSRKPLDKVANLIVRRFLVKCRSRKIWAHGAALGAALAQAAGSIKGNAPHLVDEWIAACSPLLGREEAKLLYLECVGYGLVRSEGGPKWRWAHRFVVERLVEMAEGAYELE